MWRMYTLVFCLSIFACLYVCLFWHLFDDTLWANRRPHRSWNWSSSSPLSRETPHPTSPPASPLPVRNKQMVRKRFSLSQRWERVAETSPPPAGGEIDAKENQVRNSPLWSQPLSLMMTMICCWQRKFIITREVEKSQTNVTNVTMAGDLRTHLKMCTDEKSNKCNQCDFASSHAGNLRNVWKRIVEESQTKGLRKNMMMIILTKYHHQRPWQISTFALLSDAIPTTSTLSSLFFIMNHDYPPACRELPHCCLSLTRNNAAHQAPSKPHQSLIKAPTLTKLSSEPLLEHA